MSKSKWSDDVVEEADVDLYESQFSTLVFAAKDVMTMWLGTTDSTWAITVAPEVVKAASEFLTSHFRAATRRPPEKKEREEVS